MITGQTLSVVMDGDIVAERRLVSVENDVFFVCKDEEFEAAKREGREPICIGFKSEYVVTPKNGRL